MDWKFCWIVSMIFVILFRISQLESKSKENQEDNGKETKEDIYEIPEEIRKQKQDMFSWKW